MSFCRHAWLRMAPAALLLGTLWLTGCASKGPVGEAVPAPANESAVAPGGSGVPGQAAPGSTAPEVDEATRSSFLQAVEDLKAGRAVEARIRFEQIHASHPGFSGPVVNLGIIALRENRRDDAAGYFRKAVDINPANTEALNFLGVMAREDGRFSEAEAHYRKALEIDPSFAAAHLNLGILLDLYMGRLPEALSHYETYQSLRSEPDPRVQGWIADLRNRMPQ